MNGQDLAAADIAAQIPEIDSGTAEEWRVGSDRNAFVLAVPHVFPEEGTESLRRCAETWRSGRRTRPPYSRPSLRSGHQRRRAVPCDRCRWMKTGDPSPSRIAWRGSIPKLDWTFATVGWMLLQRGIHGSDLSAPHRP